MKRVSAVDQPQQTDFMKSESTIRRRAKKVQLRLVRLRGAHRYPIVLLNERNIIVFECAELVDANDYIEARLREA